MEIILPNRKARDKKGGIPFVIFTDHHGRVDATMSILEKVRQFKPEGLLCAGDLTDFRQNYEKSLSLLDALGLPIFCVTGNHEEVPDFVAELEYRYKNFILLNNQIKKVGSYYFFGIPTQISFYWISEDEEEIQPHHKKALQPLVEKGVLDKTIFISHYPPENTLCDLNQFKTHEGFKRIRYIVEQYQPQMLLCGHTHHAFGKSDTIGSTKIINPGPRGMLLNL